MLRGAYCLAIGREIRPNYPDASENERVGTAFRAFAHPTAVSLSFVAWAVQSTYQVRPRRAPLFLHRHQDRQQEKILLLAQVATLAIGKLRSSATEREVEVLWGAAQPVHR